MRISEDELLDILEYLFTKYENGIPCYEEPDEYKGYLGNAFRIDDDKFQRIADILNEHRARK